MHRASLCSAASWQEIDALVSTVEHFILLPLGKGIFLNVDDAYMIQLSDVRAKLLLVIFGTP